MAEWLVDADVLAGSRFAVSPMHEVTAELLELPGHLAGDEVAVSLVSLVGRHRWIPDLLVLPPPTGGLTFQAELARLRATEPGAARRDLQTAFTEALPAALDRPDLPDRLGDIAEQVWKRDISPRWSRLRQLLSADIVRRSHQISEHGWAAAIDQLSPRLEWLGQSRLRINAYDRPAQDLAGGDLVFVPSSSRAGWVSSSPPDSYAVTYPAAGLRADPAPPQTDVAVERLIGGTRAVLLRRLTDPTSTTQLAAATGLSVGGVADHLRVLLDAHLIQRQRAGRVVLYRQTHLARELLDAQQEGRRD